SNASTRFSEAAASDPDRQRMHELYRRGGEARHMAPHVIYSESACPHPDCDQRLQAIDFRLEAHGRGVHDPLVTAWWNDTGFAGRCPKCGGWIHFTIQGKLAIDADQASRIPQLPDDWFDEAVVL
ncbi:MAG: hypothetical protein ACREIV_03120, partial [Planctomycetaceae bacterium]